MNKPIPSLSESDLARFWAKVDKSGDCWEWTALTDKDGYGKFWLQGYTYRANRISYAIDNKDPEKLQVCHTCDNPLCVNPGHLWTGTDDDNRDDRCNKGRSAKGERNGNSKLTTRKVKEILGSKEPHQVLATQHGVTPGLIGHIKRGRIWKHIKGNRHTSSAQTNSKTGVRGVSHIKEGKFQATFKRRYLGTFETIEEAAEEVQKARLL